ncbi:MAG: non-heme iron oxygenase ferredoxin subunit [Methanothrix sp.]|nr:non-heme iron oxygenase ferredoxin subunit [Methanothrix sp.]
MFIKLCATIDISLGEMRQFDLKDKEVLVVNLNGELYCLEGRCSHAGAPLYEGDLEGEVLTCPWHYSQFNIKDGSVLRGPAEKPLNLFRTEIRNGQLFVEIVKPRDQETDLHLLKSSELI